MRKAIVELTMLNGNVWFIPEEEFTSMGIKETPMAVVNQYLRGSRGPTMLVNGLSDMTGEEVYINAIQISEVKISYE